MIVRIKLQALTKNGMLHTYNDVPFTGEAYDQQGELLKRIYVLNQGLIIAEKTYGALVPEQPVVLQINDDAIDYNDNDDSLSYYQGTPLTGISYHYSYDFCNIESLFIDGVEVEYIAWENDGTGRMHKYEKNDEKYSYRFEWVYGRLVTFSISQNTGDKLFFRMDEDQQIKLIMPRGNYRQIYPQIPRSDLGLDFQTIDELLARDQVANKLEIDGISDNLFNDWLTAHYFSTVKHLVLSETAIAPETIKKLVKLPQLATLSIVDSKFTGAELSINQTEREVALNQALQWVHQQIGCKVQLKRYE